jgi:hypothetical protein
MSDAVDRNVRGNGEEFRVVADDPSTDAISLFSSCPFHIEVFYLFVFGGLFLHVRFAIFALGAFGDDEWSWTALVLLELQFVVSCFCGCAGEWLNSRPSIEGATGVCHVAHTLFAHYIFAVVFSGVYVPIFASFVWIGMSPMPAVAWMAPVSMLAVAWMATASMLSFWMWISQSPSESPSASPSELPSTNSVAAQFELANSSMKKDGTDTFHDDRIETGTTISSEVV